MWRQYNFEGKCIKVFHFRWLNIKRIYAAFPMLIALIRNHLKRNSFKPNAIKFSSMVDWENFIKFDPLFDNRDKKKNPIFTLIHSQLSSKISLRPRHSLTRISPKWIKSGFRLIWKWIKPFVSCFDKFVHTKRTSKWINCILVASFLLISSRENRRILKCSKWIKIFCFYES